ncbi:hypothetical protein HHK36_026251 [Tetracentron sinense]|uniref:Glabrous enhancer-binding protein-like DBD domain-containing protein n=1 Tax=Tetracentron sinense TaxID=13715 RepID=A0A835D214_TETSI|nr:hypothetical protein HHK36_026251 [Tetracentron sinense]
MASNEEDQNIYGEEDLEEEESEEEEEEEEEEEDLVSNQLEDDEEEDLNFASPSTSSSSEENPNKDSASIAAPENPSAAAIPATAIAPTALNGSPVETTPTIAADLSPQHKRQRTEDASAASEEKKPSAFDESRRLFQRLWTDEDEIGLLQGFLDFTTQRGTQNSSHHHDTGPFYDQIKTRLQLDFNKNQLVEKLRRLKKKFRNVVSRISSGKDFSFKSPHDQATFEISRKIWSNISGGGGGGGGGGAEESRLEEDEGNPQNINSSINNIDNETNNNGIDASISDKKVPRSRRRSRKRPAEDNLSNHQAMSSIPNVIEDTVRSCLSPLFKELLYCAVKGPSNTGGYGGITLNPLPLNFGANSLNFSSTEMVDEKWRKQQILELEVYSKRIELVQDQIKSALEELRSMGS